MQTFTLHGIITIPQEKFYVETGKQSKKMENLSRNNTIYFCVDDPSPPCKGVRGKGKGIL